MLLIIYHLTKNMHKTLQIGFAKLKLLALYTEHVAAILCIFTFESQSFDTHMMSPLGPALARACSTVAKQVPVGRHHLVQESSSDRQAKPPSYYPLW